MKKLLLISFLVFTNISFSQTFNLIGKNNAKLFKTGTGQYQLKYKASFGDYIFTDKITRQKREDGQYQKYIDLGAFEWFAPAEKEQVNAVYEYCKTDDPDYQIVIVWANIFYKLDPYSGIVAKINVLGEFTDVWFIEP
jgi:hypothetical protein